MKAPANLFVAIPFAVIVAYPPEDALEASAHFASVTPISENTATVRVNAHGALMVSVQESPGRQL